MSIAYTSHMMDTFYNAIYFFNDLISYFEICITVDFCMKQSSRVRPCLILELSKYSVLFNKLTWFRTTSSCFLMFKIITFLADLEKEVEIRALAAEVLKCFDRLDILVR